MLDDSSHEVVAVNDANGSQQLVGQTSFVLICFRDFCRNYYYVIVVNTQQIVIVESLSASSVVRHHSRANLVFVGKMYHFFPIRNVPFSSNSLSSIHRQFDCSISGHRESVLYGCSTVKRA